MAKQTQKFVEFCHNFDPVAGAVTIARTGGAFPCRLTIIGPGADKLAREMFNVMKGWLHSEPLVTPNVVEIAKYADTPWDTTLLENTAKRFGYAFKVVEPTHQVVTHRGKTSLVKIA